MRKLLPGNLRLFALASALTLAACGDAVPTTGLQPGSEPRLAAGSYGATLLECPTRVESVATATLDDLGGVLSLDGHSMSVPAGALPGATTFQARVPATRHVLVEFKRVGAPQFQFEDSVTLTISYARCKRKDLDRKTLRVYYVDPETRTILQDLGGVDDKVARTVTVKTDHLSSYAVGTPD